MKKAFIYFLVCLAVFPRLGAAQLTDPIQQGNEFYRQSQFDLAEQQYRLALKNDSVNATAQHNLANALYKQRKFTEAVAVLQTAQKGANDKTFKGRLFYNEGVVYTKEKELEKSIEAYKNALRNNPDDKEARENLQKAMQELKKQQQDKQNKKQQPSKMSSKEARQRLEQLQKKEEELQQKLQKRGQGSSMQKDW